jgi:hypothetical protein
MGAPDMSCSSIGTKGPSEKETFLARLGGREGLWWESNVKSNEAPSIARLTRVGQRKRQDGSNPIQKEARTWTRWMERKRRKIRVSTPLLSRANNP